MTAPASFGDVLIAAEEIVRQWDSPDHDSLAGAVRRLAETTAAIRAEADSSAKQFGCGECDCYMDGGRAGAVLHAEEHFEDEEAER